MLNYHCDKCNDTGIIEYVDTEGYQYVAPCSCVKTRNTLKNAERCGLGELLNIYTFARFETNLGFQKALYDNARAYLKETKNKWFTVLGRSGAGKSHICTAICGNFLRRGYEVRFMSWIEESRRLKARVNDGAEYERIINPLKNAEVLYIDDFFKSENNCPPTPADIKLANEILNYRYNKGRASKSPLLTIISSERELGKLVEYDEAICGRIVEMSGEYLNNLGKDAQNYRLKNYIKK